MRKLQVFIVIMAMFFMVLFISLPYQAQTRDRRGAAAGPTLGISMVDLPPGSSQQGVLVRLVAPGSLADMAGIKPGDIITALNNDPVTSTRQFMLLVASQGNTSYSLSILHDGTPRTVMIGAGGTSVAAGPSYMGPVLGIGINDIPPEWGQKGVLVQDVRPDLPGDLAGMIPGDIITELTGKPVSSQAEFLKNVAGLKIGETYSITIRRGEQIRKLQVTPVAAGSAAATAANSSKHRPTDFNVLKYAIIDPQTRVVTLVGRYDAKYATGTIPYYDLLKDAMASPYPSFSLEPTQATRSGIDAINKNIGNDVARMFSDPNYPNAWAMRLLKLILNDPALQLDRARFIKRGAAAFKLSEPETLKAMAKSAGDTRVSDEEMALITAKMLRGLGLTAIADAMDLSTAGDALGAYARLGLKVEAEDILAKFHSGQMTREQATIELETRFQPALLRGFGVAENEIQWRVNQVRSGRMSVQQLQQFTIEQSTAFLTNTVGLKLFNGWTLSHALLCKLYNVPVPQVNLDFRDVPVESILGDFLYRADFMLKTICTSPEIRERLAGFLTEQEFIYAETSKKGMRIPSEVGVEVGHRLVPGEVKIRVAPNATLVAFDTAQVRIVGWLYKEPTGARATAKVKELLRTLVTDYANYLTDNYDGLAKAFPEWHRLRETAKIIALVRWAKSNNYRLVVDQAYNIRLAPPKNTTGFWQAFFIADQQEFSMTVIAEGGASFNQQEGEAWIKPNVDTEVVPGVLRQLAESHVLAEQAVGALLDGNLDAARDLADKSARAMTGDFDRTQLPSLNIPFPIEPAPAAALSNAALQNIEDNLSKIENAKISMQKADTLQATAPLDAAKLRAEAEAQQRAAEQDLRNLKNALDLAHKNPQRTNEALVYLKPGGRVTPPSSSAIIAGSALGAPIEPAAPTPDTGNTMNDKDVAALRAKLLEHLAKMENDLERVKKQFGLLNKSVQSDRTQYEDWEKEAEKGMQKCTDIAFGALMDLTAGPLKDKYEKLFEEAQKAPGISPEDLAKLKRALYYYRSLNGASSFKDLIALAESSSDIKTKQEFFEVLRDGLNQIVGMIPSKGPVPSPPIVALKLGTYIADLSYSYTQLYFAYDANKQLKANQDLQLRAFVSMRQYMDKLLAQIAEDKKKLATLQ
jgi:membrane-associated protease RseP (regulator of RpoE activity)